jgi:hypothetical protein
LSKISARSSTVVAGVFQDLGAVPDASGKDAPKTRIFHTRVPLTPNLSDHNHSSGKSGAKGGKGSREVRYCSFFPGEIYALTITGQSMTLDRIAIRLDSIPLKGLAFSGTFGVLWFQSAKVQYERRQTLILALIGIVLAIVVARLFANLLPFRARPMFTFMHRVSTTAYRYWLVFGRLEQFP